MKTKIIKDYLQTGSVYFPDRPEWRDLDKRQRWLRARKFRATINEVGFVRRVDERDGSPSRIVYAARLRAVVSVKKINERFAGESLTLTTGVSGDTLLAAYDLLWERFVACGYATLGETFFRAAGQIERPALILKKARRGYAHMDSNGRRFSVPKWALDKGEDYAVYYTAHELAHHAFGGIHHSPTMCEIEAALLAPFDIKIEYVPTGKNRPYPQRLLRISTGQVIHERGHLPNAEPVLQYRHERKHSLAR